MLGANYSVCTYSSVAIIWSSLQINCITGPTCGFCYLPTQYELIQCLCLFLSHATFRRRHFLIRDTELNFMSKFNNCLLFYSEREFLDLQSSSMSNKTLRNKTLKKAQALKFCFGGVPPSPEDTWGGHPHPVSSWCCYMQWKLFWSPYNTWLDRCFNVKDLQTKVII